MEPLNKWSCKPPTLPSKPVKRLHIYDFDNTLFYSPSPNKMLYLYPTLQQLLSADYFRTGGWWNDPVPLELLLKMRKRDGTLKSCWNPDMVKLARMSHEQDDTISIILTGRKEAMFKNVLLEILEQSCKEDPILAASLQFNGICLKMCNTNEPTTPTLTYKTNLIGDFLQYYTDLEEITIYDDRLNQIDGFKKHFTSIQSDYPRLHSLVIPVEPQSLKLPPYLEYLYFQTVLTRHNSLERVRNNNSKLHKLQWAKPQYGFFLELKSYQKLLSKIYNVLQDNLLDDTVTGYKLNLINFFEYPCYISCPLPNGQKAQQTLLYNILTHGIKPNASMRAIKTELKRFTNPSLDIMFEEDYKRDICKYKFIFKSLGIKIRNINVEEKCIDVEVFAKFDLAFAAHFFPLNSQFNLISHAKDMTKYAEGGFFTMGQLNDMIKDKVYYTSDLGNPLAVETTFGMFSKMKCNLI